MTTDNVTAINGSDSAKVRTMEDVAMEYSSLVGLIGEKLCQIDEHKIRVVALQAEARALKKASPPAEPTEAPSAEHPA